MNFSQSKLVITAVSAVSIFLVLAYNSAKMDAANNASSLQASTQTQQALAPDVSIIFVEKNDYKAEVIGHGEVKPLHALTISAQVQGQVQSLAQSFETGKRLGQGDELLNIEDTDYQQAVAAAKVVVADATLALLEEQRLGQQARIEWERSGMAGQPDSALVLRLPQLEAAQARLESAQRELEKAQNDLNKTHINAPFDALIVSREVQPGSYLQVGSAVAEIYSTERVEIDIPLSNYQWNNLPLQTDDARPWPVTLASVDGMGQWQARVERVEQHMDDSSRQRSLIIRVDKPLEQQPPLFSGTFVEASIEGKALTNLWRIPASAISQNGDVWYVEDDDTLSAFTAEKVFEQGDVVHIKPMHNRYGARIVVRALNSYLRGMAVSPKAEAPL